MTRALLTLSALSAVFAFGVAPLGAQGLPQCQVGAAVRDPINYPAKIIAFDPVKSSYQIKMDGDGRIFWYTSSDFAANRSCQGVAPSMKSLDFFFGKWEPFTPSQAQHVTISGKPFLEYGPGGQNPPLTINANGTYSMRPTSGPPVQGRWRQLAPNEFVGSIVPPAILLTGVDRGQDWQIWARGGVNMNDNRDEVVIDEYRGSIRLRGTRAVATPGPGGAAQIPNYVAAPAAAPAAGPPVTGEPRHIYDRVLPPAAAPFDPHRVLVPR